VILAKCPLRISLVGGSTDTEAFLKKYTKGSVISFTPNLYTFVSIHENHAHKYIINYSKKEIEKKIDHIKNDVTRACFEYFKTPFCTITYNSNILSTGSGLASSSSFVIATIKAISLFQDLDLSTKEICDLSFEIEKCINPLAGQQDVYGSGVGSFKRIDFDINNPPTYRFLDMSFITNKYDMFLMNTHLVRNSTDILKTLNINKSHKLIEVVNDFERSISEENEVDFFATFNQGWNLKKQTSEEIIRNTELLRISTDLSQISSICGMKLCGAGGGGYFLLFVKREDKSTFLNAMALKFANKILIDISIDNEGVRGIKI